MTRPGRAGLTSQAPRVRRAAHPEVEACCVQPLERWIVGFMIASERG
jgi:hypothetical protein